MPISNAPIHHNSIASPLDTAPAQVSSESDLVLQSLQICLLTPPRSYFSDNRDSGYSTAAVRPSTSGHSSLPQLQMPVRVTGDWNKELKQVVMSTSSNSIDFELYCDSISSQIMQHSFSRLTEHAISTSLLDRQTVATNLPLSTLSSRITRYLADRVFTCALRGCYSVARVDMWAANVHWKAY